MPPIHSTTIPSTLRRRQPEGPSAGRVTRPIRRNTWSQSSASAGPWAPARPMLMPEYAGRCLQVAQIRGTELSDEGSILPLNLATRSQDFDRRWVLVLGTAGVARRTGVGPGPIGSHPPPNATGQ